MHVIQLSLVFVIFISIFFDEINCVILQRRTRSGCFCSIHECCSKWGYCGKTDEYCGKGCQAGPCKTSPTVKPKSFNITSDMFACVFPAIDAQLRTQRFKGFLEAMQQMKWKLANSIEAAIFLSHVSHETDGLKTLVEYCSKQGTCNNHQSSWCSIQASPNIKYYGRGWFQLSYPCNYYNTGKALGLSLLDNPDLVSQSDRIAASAAIWYYTETGMNELAQQGNFGATTRKLNEYECAGKGGYHMQAARIQTYHRIRHCFDLPEGEGVGEGEGKFRLSLTFTPSSSSSSSPSPSLSR